MDPSEPLAEALVRFIRSFGLHRPDRTPCGIDAGIADAHALSELAHRELRQSELADRLRLRKSTVSRLVDTMAARGWVQRRPASDDGRGVIVALTPSGEDAAARLARARTVRLTALFDAIPKQRQNDVLEALRMLEEAARVTDARSNSNAPGI